MARDSLSVKDNRTGREYEIPIKHNAVPATSFKQIKLRTSGSGHSNSGAANTTEESEGLKVYDPGYRNTSVIETQVSHLNGKDGRLQYRQYSIAALVGTEFEDVTSLLIWGYLPNPEQRRRLRRELVSGVIQTPPVVLSVIDAFAPSAPLVTMILAGLSAHISSSPQMMPAFVGKNLYEEDEFSLDNRLIPLLSALASVVGAAYRRRTGHHAKPPNPDGSFVQNVFLLMGRRLSPKQVSIVTRLWLLYADHGMANATAAFLHTASTRADPLSCLISALAAGYGPLHGGAIDMVYKMFERVGSPANVPSLIDEVKAGKTKLYGYGHRVYETVDPRATIMQELLQEVREDEELDLDRNGNFAIATEIDRIASSDEWFVSRKVAANVDLYGCFIYEAL